MKKISIVLIAIAVLLVIWLLIKREDIARTEEAPPVPSEAVTLQDNLIDFTKTVGTSEESSKPTSAISMSSDLAWIAGRSASIEITQVADPITGEPVGTIKSRGAFGDLGETPPFYRFQLKTAMDPVLLGEKDTRHDFVRRVTSVLVSEDSIFLRPEISISFPRSASFGGFVLRKHEDPIAHLGVILPDIVVPDGDDPTSSQWITSIRISNHEISADDFAKAVIQPLGLDSVIVLPTKAEARPATARILWFAFRENGLLVVDHN